MFAEAFNLATQLDYSANAHETQLISHGIKLEKLVSVIADC